MENPVMSLFSKVVSFAFLASTLATDSLGKSRSRARNRKKGSARALTRATRGSARLARAAASGLMDAAHGLDGSLRAATPVGRK